MESRERAFPAPTDDETDCLCGRYPDGDCYICQAERRRRRKYGDYPEPGQPPVKDLAEHAQPAADSFGEDDPEWQLPGKPGSPEWFAALKAKFDKNK